MKLHTRPASFRAQKVLIAAHYAEVPVDVAVSTSDKEIKTKAPFSKLPFLETEQGNIAESNAIAHYVASIGKNKDLLLGKNEFAAAQIKSWLEFCSNEIEVPATVACYPIIGWMKLHNEAFEKAKKDLNIALKTIDSHLKTRTFLVGERLSLADIALATTLLLPYKLLFDEKLRKTFSCATRWFNTCVMQPEFVQVIGPTVLPKVASVPKGYKAPVAKTKSEKKPKKKEAAPPAKPKKKEKHYCELLPKSPFILDAWKREYSNARDYNKVMKTFWDMYDEKGWCLFRGDYKYNEELEVPFMVSNLAGGFVQRCDGIRKYAFGVLQILKKDSAMKMTSVWLFRGDSEKLMLDANPDGDTYTWTKLDHTKEEDRKVVEDMWTADETLEGMEITDAKVFK